MMPAGDPVRLWTVFRFNTRTCAIDVVNSVASVVDNQNNGGRACPDCVAGICSDVDCGDGECNYETGVCLRGCGDGGCPGDEVCNPLTGACEALDADGDFCSGCDDNDDCNPGLVCGRAPNLGEFGVCTYECNDDGDCPDDAFCGNVVGLPICIPDALSCQ